MPALDPCPRCTEYAAEVEHLRRAVESRDVIGQAKGIIMASHRITADEAFGVLVQHSQARNVKLRELAERVALCGTLDIEQRA